MASTGKLIRPRQPIGSTAIFAEVADGPSMSAKLRHAGHSRHDFATSSTACMSGASFVTKSTLSLVGVRFSSTEPEMTLACRFAVRPSSRNCFSPYLRRGPQLYSMAYSIDTRGLLNERGILAQ